MILNLTELQMELRSIEEHISQLHTEIEKMKPQTDEQKKTDFDAITKLAKQYPIDGIEISNASEVIQKEFINSLSYLLLSDDKDIYVRLLYLSRLAMGFGLKATAEDIYKSGLEFESKDIEKVSTDLQQYRYSYLIEAFIIANLSEEASFNMLTVIADMAKIMGCDKEEIRVLAQIAKSRLLGNLEILKNIPVPSKNCWSGKLRDYVPKEWIISQRIECITICIEKNQKKNMGNKYGLSFTSKYNMNSTNGSKNYDTKTPCVIKQRPQAGSIVKCGDSILVYEEEVKKKPNTSETNFSILMKSAATSIEEEIIKETRTIKAPNDGIVFFISKKKKGKVAEQDDQYLAVYVVSFFDEYNDFCKWYAGR